jgi:hypothetical protein
MPEVVNILSLKWGKLYGPEYVNRLRRGVARHLKRPHRFVCFTSDATGLDPEVETFPIFDVDLPEHLAFTPWRKLGLFRDDLPVRGPSLFLDLDLVFYTLLLYLTIQKILFFCSGYIFLNL